MRHDTARCGCGQLVTLPSMKARSYGAKCERCVAAAHLQAHVDGMMRRGNSDPEWHAPLDPDPTHVARETDARNAEASAARKQAEEACRQPRVAGGPSLDAPLTSTPHTVPSKADALQLPQGYVSAFNKHIEEHRKAYRELIEEAEALWSTWTNRADPSPTTEDFREELRRITAIGTPPGSGSWQPKAPGRSPAARQAIADQLLEGMGNGPMIDAAGYLAIIAGGEPLPPVPMDPCNGKHAVELCSGQCMVCGEAANPWVRKYATEYPGEWIGSDKPWEPRVGDRVTNTTFDGTFTVQQMPPGEAMRCSRDSDGVEFRLHPKRCTPLPKPSPAEPAWQRILRSQWVRGSNSYELELSGGGFARLSDSLLCPAIFRAGLEGYLLNELEIRIDADGCEVRLHR